MELHVVRMESQPLGCMESMQFNALHGITVGVQMKSHIRANQMWHATGVPYNIIIKLCIKKQPLGDEVNPI